MFLEERIMVLERRVALLEKEIGKLQVDIAGFQATKPSEPNQDFSGRLTLSTKEAAQLINRVPQTLRV